jgi:outer membrane protein assembly factor BamB
MSLGIRLRVHHSHFSIRGFSFFVVRCLLCVLCASAANASWPTAGGNPERTSNIDNQPGPKQPKVLWVHRSQEQYVAAPAVTGREILFSGLGAFNSASFHAFEFNPAPGKQSKWSKNTPYLKLPVVCSAAVADGKIMFGDGMHQTDGAVLHCLRADGGQMLWQLPVPGKLVHLEGAPTIANGKVFVGSGNAGVLCIDPNRVTLEGQELDLNLVQKILEAKWKELVAKYEEEKKKDPDFAIPPNEDQLPKPAPKRLWQQGQDKWHVDAPVAVVGDSVLAASALLDHEQLGERTLFCLQSSDGTVMWKAPLRLNPWAGPTLVGDLVLVGTSSIRFDPKQVPKARGEVLAVELASGNVKWRREVPGGVLSPVAVKDKLAIFTATDGQVRAWDVTTGEDRWNYDAQAPLFAGAAAAGAVYTADLKGVVHAVNLADGKPLWKLDLATDPAVRAPGMVYGTPVVHGGRLYLATCNLEGEHARKPTVVVCIGEK